MNQFITPKCVSFNLNIFDAFFLSVIGFFILSIAVFLINSLYSEYKLNRYMNRFKKNLEEVYQLIHNYDIETFINRNIHHIKLIPFTKLEKAILKDSFSSKFDKNMHYCPDKECIICLSEFEAEDTLVTLPLCKHTFHIQCLSQWMERKMTCP